AITMNAPVQGGARPGAMNAPVQGGARPGGEIDDVASTLVWQKGQNQQAVPAPSPIHATAMGMGPPAAPAAYPGARPPPAQPQLGATAPANMMAATAVGMPPGFEEEARAASAAGAPSANTLVGVPDAGAAALPPPRIAGPRPAPAADPAHRTLVGVSMP